MEILINDVAFETNEKISIGTENRSKILSVLGRVQYKKIPDDLADTVPIRFINTAGPLNYKNHKSHTSNSETLQKTLQIV